MEPRNYEAAAAGSPPTAPVTPSTGYPTGGDPQTATPATQPGAHWFYKIGESLRNIITAAGLTPSDSDLTLLLQSIVKLVGQSNHVVRIESATFEGTVVDGNAVYWDDSNNRYAKAIADGTDKQDVVGFADVTNSLVEAFGQSALFSGLTAGARYYLSGSTAGAITTTAPTNKVSIGIAKSATALFVDLDPANILTLATQLKAQAHTDNLDYMSSLRVYEAFQKYGLGFIAGENYSETADFNNLVRAGFYHAGTTAVNAPVPTTNWTVIVGIHTTGNTFQLAVSRSDLSKMYVRLQSSSAWGAWVNISPFGYGQTWQDVSGSRSGSTVYTNSTGRAIEVAIVSSDSSPDDIQVSPNGSTGWVTVGYAGGGATVDQEQSSFVVPSGWSYRINGGISTIQSWAELR